MNELSESRSRPMPQPNNAKTAVNNVSNDGARRLLPVAGAARGTATVDFGGATVAMGGVRASARA